ncbi:uncharacterized protein DUF1707 [Nocardia caishijiensis]|uniref:Uncharacterized protein DUF1707 n=1 Tax=Nocardia caishijiensis TaxID=184756 RepID=A0ABQ6YV26_9NOCA|nr:uncharacterized protein DUF1707 [Nocardia caishijiensis]
MLDAAYAEGQLGADEYHDRVRRAGSARTLGELGGLTADLQSPAVFGPPAERKRFGRRHSGEYPARTKARDGDRARTVAALDAARADGQLDADEHTAMAELAAEARTLGELSTLVAELQQRPAAPVKPKARNTFRIVTSAAVALAAVGGFAWTIRADEPAAPAPETTINYNAAPPLVIPTPKLDTVVGFIQFRDDYRAKFGDTLVDEAVLHDEHASAVRRAPDNGDWTVDYTYRGGFDRSNSQVTTRKRDAVDIDLAQVNTDALGAVLNTAAATLNVRDGVVTHLRIADTSWVGRPAITVFVRNEVSQSGHLVLALSGEVLETNPYER